MKNKDKYEDKINNYDGDYFCNDFVKPIILKSNDCDGMCCKCRLLQAIWLEKEYEEPEVDWTKVDIDTPILVKSTECAFWHKKYFAKFENGRVYAWTDGATSWSAEGNVNKITGWNYAKLAEEEEK